MLVFIVSERLLGSATGINSTPGRVLYFPSVDGSAAFEDLLPPLPLSVLAFSCWLSVTPAVLAEAIPGVIWLTPISGIHPIQ